MTKTRSKASVNVCPPVRPQSDALENTESSSSNLVQSVYLLMDTPPTLLYYYYYIYVFPISIDQNRAFCVRQAPLFLHTRVLFECALISGGGNRAFTRPRAAIIRSRKIIMYTAHIRSRAEWEIFTTAWPEAIYIFNAALWRFSLSISETDRGKLCVWCLRLDTGADSFRVFEVWVRAR